MKRGEQDNSDNNAWKTFPGDLWKSEQHDPNQPKLSVYPSRFHGDVNTLKCRFQISFYSEYPWIQFSIKEDAPVCICCELPFLGKRKLSIFFSCLKRLKKLSTKYNGPRKTVFFCSYINWMWFFSSWQCRPIYWKLYWEF